MGIRFSNQFRMVPKGLKNFFDKLHTPRWLFVLLLIVLVLRIPSFFEPYSYGDEMTMEVKGRDLVADWASRRSITSARSPSKRCV